MLFSVGYSVKPKDSTLIDLIIANKEKISEVYFTLGVQPSGRDSGSITGNLKPIASSFRQTEDLMRLGDAGVALNLLFNANCYGAGAQRRIDEKNIMRYILPQDLRSYGLIPELIGRLPVLTYMEPLTREALRSILTEPKNSILRQYECLLGLDGVELKFEDAVLDYIVDKALEYKLGARGLRSICESIMLDLMFDLPSTKEKSFTVTLDYAKQKVDRVISN